MTPSQLLNQHVSVNKNLSDMAGVVSSNFVVFNALIFAVILLVKFGYQFIQSSK